MSRPLSHVRVLDLTRILAGPWASQNLADLGAEVIKIERPKTGDDTRSWGPPWLKDAAGQETREAAYYLSVNRGKKSVTVDLSKPAGQKIVAALAAKSDVLIENYKVGDLARYGLGYDQVRKLNPLIIYCSVTGFGQDGPFAVREPRRRRGDRPSQRERRRPAHRHGAARHAGGVQRQSAPQLLVLGRDPEALRERAREHRALRGVSERRRARHPRGRQ